jgi:hypothetical protein
MFGTSIQLAIWLAIIYFHLADYWWYIASFAVGLSGSNYVLSKRIVFVFIDYLFSIFRFCIEFDYYR